MEEIQLWFGASTQEERVGCNMENTRLFLINVTLELLLNLKQQGVAYNFGMIMKGCWKEPYSMLTRNATRLVASPNVASLGALTHTLGTFVPVIGASGFATAVAATAIGTVVGSFR
ncbi:hypothetical protein CsSME_00011174 [Camellia sinensis var. sinensis]